MVRCRDEIGCGLTCRRQHRGDAGEQGSRIERDAAAGPSRFGNAECHVRHGLRDQPAGFPFRRGLGAIVASVSGCARRISRSGARSTSASASNTAISAPAAVAKQGREQGLESRGGDLPRCALNGCEIGIACRQHTTQRIGHADPISHGCRSFAATRRVQAAALLWTPRHLPEAGFITLLQAGAVALREALVLRISASVWASSASGAA